MRQHAIALWRFTAEILSIVDDRLERDDPLLDIVDHVRDSRRFCKDFRLAELDMPDVIENAE